MPYKDREKRLQFHREYNDRNREKNKERCKEYYQANKDTEAFKIARRIRGRRSKGILNPTGELLFGTCPICIKDRQLVFDHDHNTGLFRGWICRGCNVYIERYITYGRRIGNYLADSSKQYNEDDLLGFA